MFNKKLLWFNFSFFYLTFFISQNYFAQAPDTLWTKTFGGSETEFGYYTQQTNDGGYIVAGWTKSFGAGQNDIWLIKTNSSGDTLWTKTYGGSSDENISCAQQTNDSGYILFIESDSFHPTYWKVWLVKTDELGDTIWTKVIGGNRHYFLESGLQITEGGYVFTGYTKATAAGQEDVWFVKTDTSGNPLWTKTIGGFEGDQSQAILQTSDSGFVIAAVTKSFGTGDYDVWLIKTDVNGDTIWTKTYGGNQTDWVYSIQLTSEQGFIIAGSTKSFGYANGKFDIWLIKTNSFGDTLWTKTFGGVENDGAYSVRESIDGGFILTGYTSSFGAGEQDVWLIKTDASGNLLWSKTFGGSYWDVGRCVQQTNDGGYIIVGDRFTTLAIDYNIWLIKTTPDASDVEPNDLSPIPDKIILGQNYPNPFNPSTIIEFGIPESQFVTLAVYNLLGEQVGLLVNENLSAGNYRVKWYAEEFPSGIYFYKLSAGDISLSNKMILMQ